ncbi:thiamine pyrophosphate-dependent enzyme [Bradyrhizobium sp. 521_C7_N1_3]|uniref:thiamine pyrophosphate-dependent enzyme n=1 Tax=Bradyrhizobium sp. 521_C7_N1_3 TaxID=3240368 RepID=UPI003F8CC962
MISAVPGSPLIARIDHEWIEYIAEFPGTNRRNSRLHASVTRSLPLTVRRTGYALLAVIGATLAASHRKVISRNGDGGMQLNIQEPQTPST